jgi:hypothetical protein
MPALVAGIHDFLGDAAMAVGTRRRGCPARRPGMTISFGASGGAIL